MSQSLLRCHFCPWEHRLGSEDTSEHASSLHQAHLELHVDELIRTSFLPYDEDSFIKEPRHTFARSLPTPPRPV